jgi:hypothetical protein
MKTIELKSCLKFIETPKFKDEFRHELVQKENQWGGLLESFCDGRSVNLGASPTIAEIAIESNASGQVNGTFTVYFDASMYRGWQDWDRDEEIRGTVRFSLDAKSGGLTLVPKTRLKRTWETEEI